MQSLKLFILVLVASLFCHKANAQATLSNKAEISVLTCGPGSELYSIFGHTAIRVFDPSTGIDVVYNYGTFDFNTPNFYLKFVKGDLKYYVSASSYADFIYTYRYYNRDVYEQFLNLSQNQKQSIANHLASTLTSDSRFYTYKYFDRNCTTMVADIINNTIDGSISMQNSDQGKTYRTIVCERLSNSFYENLGISLIFGYKTDKQLSNLFLPQQLLEGVNNTKINATPLARPAMHVYQATGQHEEKSLWNNYYTFTAVCVVLIYFSGRPTVQITILLLFGLLGIFFCFVGLYSYHEEISKNYNALLINPLFFIIVAFFLVKKHRAVAIASYLCIACLVLYIVMMLNKPHLILVLPLIILVAAILVRIAINAGKSNKHNSLSVPLN